MGGDLIARILDEAPWVREHRTRLLLQPMTKPDHLRDYLAREGFCTELENAVVSGKFVYTVFSVVDDGQSRTLTTLERYIGRVLEDGDSADTDRYLMRVRPQSARAHSGHRPLPGRGPGAPGGIHRRGGGTGTTVKGAWIRWSTVSMLYGKLDELAPFRTQEKMG